MDSTLIYSNYDAEIGVSTVTIGTKYGVFTSSVKIHPQDKDVASELLGCEFAEMKCQIKAAQKRAEIFEAKADGIRHALDVIWDSYYGPDKYNGHFNREAVTEFFDKLYNQLFCAKKQAEDARETYILLRDGYRPYVENLLKIAHASQNRQLQMKLNYDV